jgi:hypothetical protein
MLVGELLLFEINFMGRQQLSAAARGQEHARVYIAKEGDFLIFNNRAAGTIEIRLAEFRLRIEEFVRRSTFSVHPVQIQSRASADPMQSLLYCRYVAVDFNVTAGIE